MPNVVVLYRQLGAVIATDRTDRDPVSFSAGGAAVYGGPAVVPTAVCRTARDLARPTCTLPYEAVSSDAQGRPPLAVG